MTHGTHQARKILIAGAGAHGSSLTETVAACGYELAGFFDPAKSGSTFHGYPVFADLPAGFIHSGGGVVMGLGDNFARQRALDALPVDLPTSAFPVLVHPSAAVASSAIVGAGSVVMQAAVLGSHAMLGDFCVVNSAAVVEHDCIVNDFASLAPGAVLGGAVVLGARSAVSLSATVRQCVQLGEDSILGANSYLDRHLPNRVVAYGTPARIVRSREPGDAYLSGPS